MRRGPIDRALHLCLLFLVLETSFIDITVDASTHLATPNGVGGGSGRGGLHGPRWAHMPSLGRHGGGVTNEERHGGVISNVHVSSSTGPHVPSTDGLLANKDWFPSLVEAGPYDFMRDELVIFTIVLLCLTNFKTFINILTIEHCHVRFNNQTEDNFEIVPEYLGEITSAAPVFKTFARMLIDFPKDDLEHPTLVPYNIYERDQPGAIVIYLDQVESPEGTKRQWLAMPGDIMPTINCHKFVDEDTPSTSIYDNNAERVDKMDNYLNMVITGKNLDEDVTTSHFLPYTLTMHFIRPKWHWCPVFNESMPLEPDHAKSSVRALVDECATGAHNCHSDATCKDEIIGFTCTCRAGFFGDGVACTATAPPPGQPQPPSPNAEISTREGGLTAQAAQANAEATSLAQDDPGEMEARRVEMEEMDLERDLALPRHAQHVQPRHHSHVSQSHRHKGSHTQHPHRDKASPDSLPRLSHPRAHEEILRTTAHESLSAKAKRFLKGNPVSEEIAYSKQLFEPVIIGSRQDKAFERVLRLQLQEDPCDAIGWWSSTSGVVRWSRAAQSRFQARDAHEDIPNIYERDGVEITRDFMDTPGPGGFQPMDIISVIFTMASMYAGTYLAIKKLLPEGDTDPSAILPMLMKMGPDVTSFNVNKFGVIIWLAVVFLVACGVKSVLANMTDTIPPSLRYLIQANIDILLFAGILMCMMYVAMFGAQLGPAHFLMMAKSQFVMAAVGFMIAGMYFFNSIMNLMTKYALASLSPMLDPSMGEVLLGLTALLGSTREVMDSGIEIFGDGDGYCILADLHTFLVAFKADNIAVGCLNLPSFRNLKSLKKFKQGEEFGVDHRDKFGVIMPTNCQIECTVMDPETNVTNVYNHMLGCIPNPDGLAVWNFELDEDIAEYICKPPLDLD